MRNLIRTNFDRRELRRDRRYVSPAITVRVGGVDHLIHDWSLSGFRAARGMRLGPHGQIAGSVRVAASDSTFPFVAEAVRGDAERGSVGFRFVELSPALMRALERAVLARMVGRS
jgi:hypothetical protein